MTKMGGLRKTMPVTAFFFVIGAWALSGLPPFAGFFAKDPIIAAAAELGDTLAWVAATVAAFLSALYIGRLVFLTFFGTYRGEKHAHESPKVMTIPMGILAFAAAVGGVLTLSPTTGRIEEWLEPVFGPEPASQSTFTTASGLTFISIAVALTAVVLAWYWFASGRVAWADRRSRHPQARAFLASGMEIDEGYRRIVAAPGRAVAAFLTAFDAHVVDGAAVGVGKLSVLVGMVGRRVQTGFVRTYALGIALGAFGVLLWLAVKA
jgi:NADH-quinone oxidoreductase subunit L